MGQRLLFFLFLIFAACSTGVPSVRHQKFKFPADRAFVGLPSDREVERIGFVRARSDFNSFDPERPENDVQTVCRNYYNRAVQDLVKFSREKGGDGVVEIKSVVFTMSGKSELHDSPECSEEGTEGQILVQGVAVKWKPKAATSSVAPSPTAVKN